MILTFLLGAALVLAGLIIYFRKFFVVIAALIGIVFLALWLRKGKPGNGLALDRLRTRTGLQDRSESADDIPDQGPLF